MVRLEHVTFDHTKKKNHRLFSMHIMLYSLRKAGNSDIAVNVLCDSPYYKRIFIAKIVKAEQSFHC